MLSWRILRWRITSRKNTLKTDHDSREKRTCTRCSDPRAIFLCSDSPSPWTLPLSHSLAMSKSPAKKTRRAMPDQIPPVESPAEWHRKQTAPFPGRTAAGAPTRFSGM